MDDTDNAEEKPQRGFIKFIHGYAKKEKMTCQFVVSCDEETKTYTAKLIIEGEIFSAKGKTRKEAKNNAAYLAVKKMGLDTKYLETKIEIDYKTEKQESARLNSLGTPKKRASNNKRPSREKVSGKDDSPKHLLINKGSVNGIGQTLTHNKTRKEASGEIIKQHSGRKDSAQKLDSKQMGCMVSNKLEMSSKTKSKSLKNQNSMNKRSNPSQNILPSITNTLKKKKSTSKVKEKSVQINRTNKNTSKEKTLNSYEDVMLPHVLNTPESKKGKQNKKNKTVSSATQIQSNACSEHHVKSLPNIFEVTKKPLTFSKNKSLQNQARIKTVDEFQTKVSPYKNDTAKKKKGNKKGENKGSILSEGKIVSDKLATSKKKSKNKNKVNSDGRIGNQSNSETAIVCKSNQDAQARPSKSDWIKTEINYLINGKRNLKPLMLDKQPVATFSAHYRKESQKTDNFTTALKTSPNKGQGDCKKIADKKIRSYRADSVPLSSTDKRKSELQSHKTSAKPKKSMNAAIQNSSCFPGGENNFVKIEKIDRKDNGITLEHKLKMKNKKNDKIFKIASKV